MKLLKYLQGFRKGKEAHRLEKEAMQDPFLADAIDGYDSTKENSMKRIELLRKQVSTRAVGKKRNHAVEWSIAACLLLGIGISTYFLYERDSLPEDTRIALEELSTPPSVPQSTIPKPSAEAEMKEEIAEVRAKKVISEPQQNQEVSEQALQLSTNEAEKSVSELSATQPMAETIHIVSDSTRKAATVPLLADTRQVRGKVTDQHGEPVVGASIVVKGTNQGTLSDIEGNFALKVDGQKELVVNYIGYEAVTLPADTGKNMLVAMNGDQQQLSEVVVVGYGDQTRKSTTGAVAASKKTETPQPIIGWKAYRKYLKENLQHPTDAECKQAKGKAVLTFRVNKAGRPENITVKISLCPSADKEAVKLIERGSNWTTGGNPVEITIKF